MRGNFTPILAAELTHDMGSILNVSYENGFPLVALGGECFPQAVETY